MALAPTRFRHGHRPGPGLRAIGDVRSVRLTWHEVPGATGYRVHGVPGAGRRPGPADLLAVTSVARFVHPGLDPAGERWSYAVLPMVPGRRCRPLRASAWSRPSVTVTGTPLATVGVFDGTGRGLALAACGFGLYSSMFPHDVDFRCGRDPSETGWSHLHPGPEDAWAGRRAHRFRLRFDLVRPPAAGVDLAIWLADRHPTHPGSATLAVNGSVVEALFFDTWWDTTVGRPGPGAPPLHGAGPAYLERSLDPSLLRAGENVIELTKDHGSWIAYDALGLFARRG